MFFLQFLQQLKEFSVIENVGLDDTIDRLNYQGNVIVLLILMTFVTIRQYYYSPMSCFITSRVGGKNQDKYLQNMCWTEGLYPVNFSRTMPQQSNEWDKLSNQHLEYYAWIPLLLGVQAIIYLLPWLLWQLLSFSISGVHFVDVMKIGRSAHLVIGEVRQRQVTNIANGLFSLMQIKSMMRKNLLFLSYLLIKSLYVVVNCVQLMVIYYLLTLGGKDGQLSFGTRIVKDIIKGRSWSETSVFPRSGMCRFPYDNLGAINHMTAQCSLPINMINEKIYIFLYFYVIVNIILAVCSLLWWLIGFRVCGGFTTTLKGRILVKSTVDDRNFKEFVDNFLGTDGCFVLRMVNANVGSLLSEDIINGIYQRFISKWPTERPIKGEDPKICAI